jgi:2-polyprenyl-3-methyl-5-hydroxy-6-metoxy-1,4-benzoquinol methylase
MNDPGLDYAFLKYIGVSVDGEGALHSFYLPLLQGHQRILDLGCGMGGFVKLLCAHGFDAYGVDSDPQSIAEARQHEIPVVEAEVVAHLRTLAPGSLDAIFSAHMVEHMPYEVVLETIQLAQRALKPGGRLLLVTPNPRALVTHLELYHMHFGHMALYHPKLLSFFMSYAGFARTEQGENPHTMPAQVAGESPLRNLPSMPTGLEQRPPKREILPKPTHPLRKAIWYGKMALVQWLVQPYFDQARREICQAQAVASQTQAALHDTLAAINRPFECYVIGDK